LTPLELFRRKPRHYGLLLLLVAALSAWGIARLDVQTDVLKMMPEDDPVFSSFSKSVRHFGGIDNLLVVCRVEREQDLEDAFLFVDALAERLGGLEEGLEVTHRPPDPTPYLHLFFSNLAVLSTDAEWTALRERLDPAAVRSALRETRLEAQTPAPGLKPFLALDPLRLHRVYAGRLRGPEEGFQVDLASGYLLSRDHRRLLIVIKPAGAAQDIGYATRLIGWVEEEVEAVRREMEPGVRVPDVELGGGFRIAAEDARIIRFDILLQVISSLGAVLLLFWFCFGRLGTLAFAFIPLALGLAASFGFAGLALREINAASSGFAALLIGLGIDFVIVAYGRYVEERTAGADLDGALAAVRREVNPGIFWGAVTTMATFGVFLLVRLRGLKEMGLLTALGIGFIMIFTFTLLPVLLHLDERLHRRCDRLPLLRISSFGVEAVIAFSVRHARAVAGLVLAGAVLMGALAWSLPFADDAQALRSSSNRGIQLQKELGDHFGQVTYPSVVLIEAQNLQDLLALDAQLGLELDRLAAEGVVRSHTGLSSFIPPLEVQRRNLVRARAADAAAFEADFTAACRETGLNPEAFAPFLAALRRGLGAPRLLDGDALDSEGLRDLTAPLVARDNGAWLTLHSIHYRDDTYRREPPKALEAWVEGRPGYTLTGINAMAKHLRDTVRSDAWKATVLGLLFVTALLGLDFRSLRWTALALLPLVCGLAWMLGTMRLAGIPLNSMNIYVAAMIIGIGVDYSIHVLHRFRGAGGDFHRVAQTGKAVLFAALTTIFGFGSLVLSHFPGLRSMGFVAVFGTLYCALFTLTLLPALLARRRAV
jgi:hypothetical protein